MRAERRPSLPDANVKTCKCLGEFAAASKTVLESLGHTDVRSLLVDCIVQRSELDTNNEGEGIGS